LSTLLALLLAQSVAVVDATEKVYRDDASLPGPAAAAQIEAARNEFEGFQVVVKGPASNVSVAAGPLIGPGGAQLLSSSAGKQGAIMVYREAFIALPSSGGRATDPAAKEGNAPDALVPQFDEFYQEARNAQVASVASGQNAVFFVDVHVPPDAAFGVYTGQVTVTANAAQTQVPVTLTVYPFALPSTPTLKTVIRFGWNAATIQYPSLSGQCCNDTVAQMHLLHAILGVNHRASIHAYDYGNFDLTAYKRNFGALLNGAAGTLLAGARPTVVQYLGPHGAKNTLASWRSFFVQNGWLDSLVDYAADEPANGQNSNWCTLAANAAEDAAAGVRVVTTASIEQAGAASCGGTPLDTALVNVFVPVVDQLQPTSMGTGHSTIGDYAGWRKGSLNGLSNEVWEYQSCDSWGCGSNVATGWPSYAIDHSALRARALEWISFRNGIGGELYWGASEAWNDLTEQPWVNQFATGGNGDGTLIYPGAASSAQVGGTHDVPLASLRLKMLREGIEDYEYMNILEQLGDAQSADAEIDSVFPTAHDVASASVPALYAARAAMACRIVTDQRPDWTCDPATWGTNTLTVSTGGVGTGTLTSSPAGIDCGSGGSACSARFAAGTRVTLLATPDATAGFDGFSGGCTGVENTCVVDLAAAQSVVASFGPPPGHLTAAPLSVAFAAVQVRNAPPPQWVVLLDDGGNDVSWSAASDDAAVSLSDASGTLAAGASATLTLTAAAQADSGVRTSHLTIVSAQGSTTIPMTLSFTDAPPPPPDPPRLEITPLSLSFSAQAGQAPAAQSVIITDTGGQGMSFGISSDDPAVVPGTTSGDLAPGASLVVPVSVSASAEAGSRSANLTVNAGAAGQATVAVAVAVAVRASQPVSAPPVQAASVAHGCSHSGSAAGWLFVAAALAFAWRRGRSH